MLKISLPCDTQVKDRFFHLLSQMQMVIVKPLRLKLHCGTLLYQLMVDVLMLYAICTLVRNNSDPLVR